MKPVFDENGLAAEPGEIRCFYYDAATSEYTGWSDEYINVGVSMPGNSTYIDPGEEVDGKISVFANGQWEMDEDHRGDDVYSTTDASVSTVDYIGPVKDGYTTIAPSSPYEKWDGEKWVIDSDAQRAADIASADAEKQAKIDQANTYISNKQWPSKLALGRLSDSDKTLFNGWLDYLDALDVVDTSTAPDITWPTSPESQTS